MTKGIYLYLLFLSSIMTGLAGCSRNSLGQSKDFGLHSGDLLFQDLDCGELCDAIEAVTQGYNGYNFSHVGIVSKKGQDDICVIEAVSAGVVATDISTFLNRSMDKNGRPKVIVGRLKESFRDLVPEALNNAVELKGKPYDKVFAVDNNSYYCSELIYEIFLRANSNRPLFELQPMTFKDPATGETLGVWKEYFADLKEPVPEGELGVNPGGISRSLLLDIVYVYGEPDKKEQDE